MKLAVFPSSIETSRALILRLVELMNEEPDRIFNIAVSGGYHSLEPYENLLGGRTLCASRRL